MKYLAYVINIIANVCLRLPRRVVESASPTTLVPTQCAMPRCEIRAHHLHAFAGAAANVPLMSFAIPAIADTSDVRARDPRGACHSGRRLTLDALA